MNARTRVLQLSKGVGSIYAIAKEHLGLPGGAPHTGIPSKNGGAIDDSLLFEIQALLSFAARCSRAYWTFIASQEHPLLAGHETDVTRTLSDDQIMASDLWVYARRRLAKNIGVAFDPASGQVNRTKGIWGKE
jgi:hypothetical protein